MCVQKEFMDDANKKTFEHWTPLGQSRKGSLRPLRPPRSIDEWNLHEQVGLG